MISATSARGYDWTAARATDLWRWHAEDLETADVFAASNNTAAATDHLAMAAAKLEAIERKLKTVVLAPALPEWLPFVDGTVVSTRLRFRIPDAERIYGSAYLARHPEMQLRGGRPA